MKNLSESILHELTKSTDLTARVTYHSEDGTRDYIAGKLSDGRYFLIGQQEQITVSDKDLPKLAKKDMDDFRYDEGGDKEFIEAIENGTKLDKNSDLAKIIINASRKHLDDGCYLLSESAKLSKSVSHNLNTKSRRKAKKLNESITKNLNEKEKYYYITGANNPEETGYEYEYNSVANTDVIDMLNELKRYFTQSEEDVKEIIANAKHDPGVGQSDIEMLKFCAEKTQEMLDKINSTWE